MKFRDIVALFLAGIHQSIALEQYTPDRSDWSTFYSKAVLDHEKNTDHSPDGVFWIDRDDWVPWDGTIYNPELYSRSELAENICPGNTVRGMYELFEATTPFADNVNPTKAEVDNWHAIVLNHVRAMVGYSEEEYFIRPDKCLHLRALWSTEKMKTRKWDNDKYPGTCEGTTNPHCGEGFIPDRDDQQEYLPDDIDYCVKRAGSAGIFSAAKSNIPWSIKWIRPFCYTLSAEGFWGGHTGPWFHRSQFGWDWRDNNPDDFNSNAGLRAKWSGPSGASKYQNPDTAEERWRINREGVNPNPRFNAYECENIIWNGGVHNATECYDRMMSDDNCGKRFMTMSSGFGCACYPVDMSTCHVKAIGNRKTWDFEPVDSTWDGLLIDTTKQFSNNNLPFNGRRCPNIKWKVKAGDPEHCLQKIVENDYFGGECGRKFLTWNSANGGCACYPPEQETCTRAESIGESGRQTFDLEVDPAYNTPEPTTSPRPTTLAPAPVATTSAPVAPTSAPVEPTSAPVTPTSAPATPTSSPVEPTSAPVEPTSAPIEPTSAPISPTDSPVLNAPISQAPVSSPSDSCSDNASGYFLLKTRNISVNGERIRYGQVQSCAWLAEQEDKDEICDHNVSYHIGKAYKEGTNWRESEIPDGTFGPAQHLCKSTCNSCAACYENSNSRWFRKVKSRPNKPDQVVKQNCEWLASRNEVSKTKYCKQSDTLGGYQPASMECPVTCSFVTGECDDIPITSAPTPVPPAGVEYLGCYKDKKNDRALPESKGRKKSIEECAELCSEYKYFGLQRSYHCRCGDGDYDKHGAADTCDCHDGRNVGRNNCVFTKEGDSSESAFWE